MTKDRKPGPGMSRRSVVKGSLMAASLAGAGAFYGPWLHNRAYAQGKKPIKLGLTNDASGQFGNSGQKSLVAAINAGAGIRAGENLNNRQSHILTRQSCVRIVHGRDEQHVIEQIAGRFILCVVDWGNGNNLALSSGAGKQRFVRAPLAGVGRKFSWIPIDLGDRFQPSVWAAQPDGAAGSRECSHRLLQRPPIEIVRLGA